MARLTRWVYGTDVSHILKNIYTKGSLYDLLINANKNYYIRGEIIISIKSRSLNSHRGSNAESLLQAYTS